MPSRHRLVIHHRRIVIGCLVALTAAGLLGGASANASKRRPSVKIAVVPSAPTENQAYGVRLSGYSAAFRHLFLTVVEKPCSKLLPKAYGFFVRKNHNFDRTIPIANVGPAGKLYACAWMTVKPRFARKNTIVFRQRPFTVNP